MYCACFVNDMKGGAARFVRGGAATCRILAGSQGSVIRMKLFKVLFVFLLLGGDFGLEPASLEAFLQQPYGCDGRANLLFAPVQPFLLRRPQLTGGITLLILAMSLVLRGISVTLFGPAMMCFKHWLVSKIPLFVINHNPSVLSTTWIGFTRVTYAVCW